MKKVVFAFVLLCFSTLASAQETPDWTEQKVMWGFRLGGNFSSLQNTDQLPLNLTANDGAGLQLGILADYQLTKKMHLMPKVDLNFANTSVDVLNADGSQESFDVMPVNIQVMMHLAFKKEDDPNQLYGFVGPSYRQPIPADDALYPSNPDLAIDFGVGFQHQGQYFFFAPELRYSFGLLDVNTHPDIKSLRFHQISLSFNFFG